jgi:hypothetical protein
MSSRGTVGSMDRVVKFEPIRCSDCVFERLRARTLGGISVTTRGTWWAATRRTTRHRTHYNLQLTLEAAGGGGDHRVRPTQEWHDYVLDPGETATVRCGRRHGGSTSPRSDAWGGATTTKCRTGLGTTRPRLRGLGASPRQWPRVGRRPQQRSRGPGGRTSPRPGGASCAGALPRRRWCSPPRRSGSRRTSAEGCGT